MRTLSPLLALTLAGAACGAALDPPSSLFAVDDVAAACDRELSTLGARRLELADAWRVEMPVGTSFRDVAAALGLSWDQVFRAYRAGGRRVLRECSHDPERTAPAVRMLVVPDAIPGARGSFFRRMPLDDWETPGDGRWAVPRSGGRRKHKGIDMHAPEGDPIYAVASGWVYRAWTVKPLHLDGGYGNYVILEHPPAETSGQRYWTYYTHMRDPPEVHEGEWVPAGMRLGSVGRTPVGRFENPHLHFEVRHDDGSELGKAVNPTPFGPFRQHFVEGEGAF